MKKIDTHFGDKMPTSDPDALVHSDWIRLLLTIARSRRAAATEGVAYSELQRAWLLFIAERQEAWVAGFRERLDRLCDEQMARHGFPYPRIFVEKDLNVHVSPSSSKRVLKTIDPLLAESAPYKLDKIQRFHSRIHQPSDIHGPNYLIEYGNSGIYRVDDGMHRLFRAQEMGWSAVEVTVTPGSSNPIPPTDVIFEFNEQQNGRAHLPGEGPGHSVLKCTELFYQYWTAYSR